MPNRVIIDVYGDDDLSWKFAIGDSDSKGEGVDPRDAKALKRSD
ncbi:MAG: hypothetical protein VYE73_02500 [Acidobacteriota bacterium]|nr:hypothetical protein [Acidobacteriota bacterium]